MFAKTLTGITFAAISAFALDRQVVSQMAESAKTIETEAARIASALKSKKADPGEVKLKIDELSGSVVKLRELVARVESGQLTLSERDRADWQLVKDKVTLLEIFHAQKKKLADQDVARHRSLIRAHAGGLAKRAQKLQETVARLERS